ncbi:unnamed protein product [Caenorhabditis bovis]|uniref:DUF38 domain-containing protein n=1 Tax=Caenorhabditis bovis TaxID=2654633 RepID=A0A8S1ED10_9PELO|nr:unnamed protein product [Caenorhabditis bovis]
MIQLLLILICFIRASTPTFDEPPYPIMFKLTEPEYRSLLEGAPRPINKIIGDDFWYTPVKLVSALGQFIPELIHTLKLVFVETDFDYMHSEQFIENFNIKENATRYVWNFFGIQKIAWDAIAAVNFDHDSTFIFIPIKVQSVEQVNTRDVVYNVYVIYGKTNCSKRSGVVSEGCKHTPGDEEMLYLIQTIPNGNFRVSRIENKEQI